MCKKNNKMLPFKCLFSASRKKVFELNKLRENGTP